MERLEPAVEVLNKETDKEVTQRLLGNLGLYTCELDTYINSIHEDSVWKMDV